MGTAFDMTQFVDLPEGMGSMLAAHWAQCAIGEPPLCLGQNEQDALYLSGCGYYNQRKYLEAMQIFVMLANEDMGQAQYFKALAACQQMMGEYETAAGYYAFAYFLDLADPSPLFHISQCLMAIGHREHAREACQTFIEKAGSNASCSTLLAHAREVLSNMRSAAPMEKAK